MKVKPMIFNTEMVRALLDGRKVQTRRPVKHQPAAGKKWRGWVIESSDRKREGCASWADGENCRMFNAEYAMPLCKSGDLIYVRETFVGPLWDQDAPYPENGYTNKYCEYKADNNQCPEYVDIEGDLQCAWKPSIHMPRWASRLTLKVTGVRVERVQDISETDAVKEGFEGCDDVTGGCTAFGEFSQTWSGIYGEESWNRNDWVWVIDFEVIRQNVDEYLKQQETKAG